MNQPDAAVMLRSTAKPSFDPLDSRVEASDRELIERCRGGESAAWDEFVDRFGRLVYSIPIRAGLAASDADDVFQRVFSIAWKELEHLRDLARVAPWLIKTTYRESWRLRRVLRTRADRASELVSDVASSETPSDEQVDQWERQHKVRTALSQLDERCQKLIHALFFESPEPSYQELAERIGTPIGSLGPTRSRCLTKMEQLLRATIL